MKKFDDYLTNKKIVIILCRIRAKLAKQRNKKHLVHVLSSDKSTNYHINRENAHISDDHKRLSEILPSRRKWKKIGQKERKRKDMPLNSIERNMLAIAKTINSDLTKEDEPSYLSKLKSFTEQMRHKCYDATEAIERPRIYPKPKDKLNHTKNVCRPIALYPLMDKLIISIANKYFTDLFDEFFDNSSFAFRSPRKIDGKSTSVSHHDSFRQIIKYRKDHANEILFVAECDMMKFYDTVNHKIIKKAFDQLIKKVKKCKYEFHSDVADNIFQRYLRSYSFNKDVFGLNYDAGYFDSYHIPYGEYGWVEHELKKMYGRQFDNVRIGVPQGGALSGLIANIVLDYADRCVNKTRDSDLLYVRFCDDIIIMHPKKRKCKKAYKRYKRALIRLKLIPHVDSSKGKIEYGKKYWEKKSKRPYMWGPRQNGAVPWIGFVGYEINSDGDVRVRKSSIKQEMEKQFDLIRELETRVLNGKNRAKIKTIEESAINRLIGMSVGRVKLWNYKTMSHDMCWINGFQCLTDNKYSRIQLKRLDRARNHLMDKFRKKLSEVDDEHIDVPEKNRQLVFYGKPFSYYYAGIEKLGKT